VLCIYLASLFAAIGLALLAYFILREMSLREKHSVQLKAREEWFRVTLTSVGEAVIATDEQGRVTFLNPLAERLTGLQMAEAMGRTIQEVFPIFNEYSLKAVENPVRQVIEEGKTVGLANHTVLKNRDGSMTPIEDSASPIWDDSDKMIGVVLVFRDATLSRKAEELLRRTEKLAAAARLSATVAHEINNPLEAVGNLIYLAKLTPGLPGEAVERLELAEQELERVSHITRQTLGFYRESNVPDAVQIDQLIETVLMLYSNKLKTKNIRVERHFGVCPPIHGLSGELKQAISNLISNAADAVGSGGMIRVGLVCVEDAGSRMVHVSIEDDGPGIANEHIERIFEPFFTTKKDVGTGLGLWVTKEIVARHGGSIEVHSRREVQPTGTTFLVRIPLTMIAETSSGHELQAGELIS
jgi:PAS domain S-box-containing protein